MKIKITISILLFLASLKGFVFAQIPNLSTFDEYLLHYGIAVGYTHSKLNVKFTEDEIVRQHLQNTASYYAPGFHIAIIGDLRLNRYMNLRLLPGITLVERNLHYGWSEYDIAHDSRLDVKRAVESVYGDIPLELKIRAERWRNFRPYLLGGIRYGFDFASLKNNKNKTDDSIVRLKPHDFSYTAGVGFDFYLRYFKFAIEAKMSFGLINLNIKDDTYYTKAIEKLKTRTFSLSFTFEG